MPRRSSYQRRVRLLFDDMDEAPKKPRERSPHRVLYYTFESAGKALAKTQQKLQAVAESLTELGEQMRALFDEMDEDYEGPHTLWPVSAPHVAREFRQRRERARGYLTPTLEKLQVWRE